jgi:hypothetical protein
MGISSGRQDLAFVRSGMFHPKQVLTDMHPGFGVEVKTRHGRKEWMTDAETAPMGSTRHAAGRSAPLLLRRDKAFISPQQRIARARITTVR